MSDDQPRIITRRDILRRAAAVGTAAVTAPVVLATEVSAAGQRVASAPPPVTTSGVRREATENLTAAEADLLEAVVDRLIPSDQLGPGAKEARVVHYIDRSLGGALAGSKPAYSAGLASLDRYAHTSRGKGFTELPGSEQDALLTEVEAGTATGFTGRSSVFFTLVLNHTRQGMFSDPYYGGNVNFAGWDLLGYPGIRTMVTAADQKSYEAGQLTANHKSAYDYDTFNKTSARVAEPAHGDRDHGD